MKWLVISVQTDYLRKHLCVVQLADDDLHKECHKTLCGSSAECTHGLCLPGETTSGHLHLVCAYFLSTRASGASVPETVKLYNGHLCLA